MKAATDSWKTWLSSLRLIAKNYGQIMAYLTMAVMFVVSIVWSNHVAADAYNRAVDNEKRLCAVLTISDSAYQTTPPTTPIGKRFAAAMHQLVQDYGC